jgi:hypothetical protein
MMLFEQAATGDCYEAAAQYLIEHAIFPGKEKDIILVHGEVTGQGPIEGLKYGHAWIEQGGMVIDVSNGRNLRMPKKAYYKLGRIGKNVHKYTVEEARKKLLDTQVYGPWDLKTESGL